MEKARSPARFLFVLMLAAAVCLFPAMANGASASLTTSFSGNVTFQGNMFDVTVQPGSDIVITAFDINILGSAQPVPVRAYWREGGYQGYETNESAWTLLQESDVTSSGSNTPTPLPLDSGLTLTKGKTYGFYITVNASHDVCEMVYTYSANVYADARISISTAAGLSWPLFTDPHAPRTWNGTIYYTYTPPQTGDSSVPFLWLAAALTALAGGTAAMLWRRRKTRRG
ncbi:MAG: LPXTG cell wall anchor domain-containing protein [Clostridiales bacterium]|nr:LPXTG cell wall anchor domain-containing protein [Clostridiales bacterium]